VALRVSERDRRAVMIEGGMQNSGLALGIIAVQFNSDLGMVIIASLWGIWHIVSGCHWLHIWRRKDARLGH
jgi:BASS family bile acid:Na+ symporter